MSETDVARTEELRRDVARALARLTRYEIVLRNIAGGHWNAGRADAISVNEYAREALGPSVEAPAPIPQPKVET